MAWTDPERDPSKDQMPGADGHFVPADSGPKGDTTGAADDSGDQGTEVDNSIDLGFAVDGPEQDPFDWPQPDPFDTPSRDPFEEPRFDPWSQEEVDPFDKSTGPDGYGMER